jgi:hypothetical protein
MFGVTWRCPGRHGPIAGALPHELDALCAHLLPLRGSVRTLHSDASKSDDTMAFIKEVGSKSLLYNPPSFSDLDHCSSILFFRTHRIICTSCSFN